MRALSELVGLGLGDVILTVTVPVRASSPGESAQRVLGFGSSSDDRASVGPGHRPSHHYDPTGRAHGMPDEHPSDSDEHPSDSDDCR
jgi:hypothetical protein